MIKKCNCMECFECEDEAVLLSNPSLDGNIVCDEKDLSKVMNILKEVLK